ncbi:hypothetical protein CPB85DRAFT_1561955 [Mucidula mucida]|nr:hypothetical protein CPB85DRAFT_1561955 [Mucidula mucida]
MLSCLTARVYMLFTTFARLPWPDTESDEPCKLSVLSGQYNVMPELSLSVPFNPFKVDIFAAAWTILAFFENYGGLDDIKVFFQTFCTRRPEDRPTAAEALATFESFVSAMKPRQRKYLVWNKEPPSHHLPLACTPLSSTPCGVC